MRLKSGRRNDVIPQLALLIPLTMTEKKPTADTFEKAFEFYQVTLPEGFGNFQRQYELYYDYWTAEKVRVSRIHFIIMIPRFSSVSLLSVVF